MAYSIINPWKFGIGRDNVAKSLGYEYRLGDDSPSGWWKQGDEGWSRVRFDDGDDASQWESQFSDAFDPKEAQKQNDFLSKFVPALKTGRSDIWNAYMGGYGSEQEAIKNLYLDLGEYGGGYNLIDESRSDGGSASFYDPTHRSLTKFLGGPADLFKQAASDPAHFGIVGGPGYLPYSWDQVSADPTSTLRSLGLFLDDQGKPIIGGVRSTPNNNRQFLANFATMLPITIGTSFMTAGLGGQFPGIDVATGAAMEAGTTGLSLSSALGLNDLPSWLSSGIDKLGNNVLTQVVQGKNPFDNPLSLATPFLKGLDLTGGIGESISNLPSEIDTFNTAASSWIDRLSDEGNMSFFEDLLGGDYGSYIDLSNSGGNYLSNLFGASGGADPYNLYGGLDLGTGLNATPDWWNINNLDPFNVTGPTDWWNVLAQPGYLDLANSDSGVNVAYDGTGDPNSIRNILSRLLGGSGNTGQLGALAGAAGAAGGRGLLDYLGSLAPIGAFTAYAMNQSPFDTSRQESLWAKYNPDAVAMPYDLETGRGREALNSNLTRRGVAGSSFGNFDLASFDTLRSLGRQDLINRGALSSLGIANSITEAEARSQEQKNRLLGAALNAAGMAMSPRGAVSTYNPWGLA